MLQLFQAHFFDIRLHFGVTSRSSRLELAATNSVNSAMIISRCPCSCSLPAAVTEKTFAISMSLKSAVKSRRFICDSSSLFLTWVCFLPIWRKFRLLSLFLCAFLCRMFKSVCHCPQQFNLPESKIRPFEKILLNYETQLLSGAIFQVSRSHSVSLSAFKLLTVF